MINQFVELEHHQPLSLRFQVNINHYQVIQHVNVHYDDEATRFSPESIFWSGAGAYIAYKPMYPGPCSKKKTWGLVVRSLYCTVR